jgi:hypothetical protein
VSLISWEKICKPKSWGGLTLRDPTTLNKVLSVKIWWRWLKHPHDSWARLQRNKYAPNIAENHLIRWDNNTSGSLIWNAAKKIHSLILDHAFWQVCNKITTSFLNNSWQQWLVLVHDTLAENFLPPATQARLFIVADYFQVNPFGATWKCCKCSRRELHIPKHVDLQPWYDLTNSIKIKILQGEDILIWGHSSQGTFNIQESYSIK